MHLTSVEHGVMGSYAIIGAHLTIANGAAWSAQYRGSGQVAVCFFGDGTTNIGAFHEALNYAAVCNLPVVFVCENNLYMEYTADLRHHRRTALRRPTGPPPTGWTASSSTATMPTRVPRRGGCARAGPRRRRPVAHRGADVPARRPLAGRPGKVPAAAEELDAWLEHDPLKVYRGRLVGSASTRHDLDEIDARGRPTRSTAATEAAKAGAGARRRRARSPTSGRTEDRHGGN